MRPYALLGTVTTVTWQVSANIPTVAQQIQGEVVAFASSAIEKMRAAGKNILLEVVPATLWRFLSYVFRSGSRTDRQLCT